MMTNKVKTGNIIFTWTCHLLRINDLLTDNLFQSYNIVKILMIRILFEIHKQSSTYQFVNYDDVKSMNQTFNLGQKQAHTFFPNQCWSNSFFFCTKKKHTKLQLLCLVLDMSIHIFNPSLWITIGNEIFPPLPTLSICCCCYVSVK